MAVECEGKFKVDALDPFRQRLTELGGVDRGEAFERNWVLDTPDNALYRNGTLLRVRNTGGDVGILTVKRKCGDGAFKTREEVESRVDRADVLVRQLEMLGFGVQWIYEKRRATWLWRECVIALDTAPELGCFVEIEGAPEGIREVAAALGLDCDSHLGESYLELWRAHLRQRGDADRHMVFASSGPAKG